MTPSSVWGRGTSASWRSLICPWRSAPSCPHGCAARNTPLSPFWASFGAVAANTGLNYLLIFGKLGAPTMGVTGAAIATLVSQLLNLLLILIGFAVCLQKEAERPLTVEIWTRWAGVLCLFSEYNGEPDLLFRLAQVKSAAIGDGHAQLIERTGGKFRYSLAVLVCDRPQCRIDLC